MTPEYLDIPLFPLPNVTLFPRTHLHLHVFEPRYRAMLENCLRGDRMMGVALLREGWQSNYFGRPPVHRVFGVGRIVDHEQLSDGRSNIALEGMYRVRLVEEFATEPYRTAHCAVLQDRRIDERHAESRPLLEEAIREASAIGATLPEMRDTLRSACRTCPHPGVVADLLSAAVVVDPYDRQSILSETDPIRRLKLVIVQLRRVLHQLGRDEAEREREEVPGME